MMTIIAIILLVLNLFFMLFFYLKLKNRFSDRASINNIKNETQKLVAQIAFQTDQSVTIMEDKIKEANSLMAELDKKILLADKEEEKRSAADKVYQSLAETAKNFSDFDMELIAKNRKPIIANEDPAIEEPIKIYTKQILSPKLGNPSDNSASMKEQIIEMAKKGLSIELIAEKIPLPAGEIELIISMYT